MAQIRLTRREQELAAGRKSKKGVGVTALRKDDNRFYQWLLYSEYEKIHLTHGIGVAALRDDYVPFSAGNPDIIFPYRQFIRKYDKRKKSELWLEELSKLIKMDKDCINRILADRQPAKRADANEWRLQYVRELAENKNSQQC